MEPTPGAARGLLAALSQHAAGVVADGANATALAESLPFPSGDRVLFVFGRDWLTDPDGALRRALARRDLFCA